MSQDKSPREWTIAYSAGLFNGGVAEDICLENCPPKLKSGEEVPVIERAAYDRLAAELMALMREKADWAHELAECRKQTAAHDNNWRAQEQLDAEVHKVQDAENKLLFKNLLEARQALAAAEKERDELRDDIKTWMDVVAAERERANELGDANGRLGVERGTLLWERDQARAECERLKENLTETYAQLIPAVDTRDRYRAALERIDVLLRGEHEWAKDFPDRVREVIEQTFKEHK